MCRKNEYVTSFPDYRGLPLNCDRKMHFSTDYYEKVEGT